MSFWGKRIRAVAARLALAAALVGLVGGVFAAAPAYAADESAVLQITKTVQKANLVPGDVLSYTIAVECLSADCVDAQVVDALPSEFDALTLNPNVVVTPPPGGSSTFSWSGRTLTVGFSHAGGAGIAAGDGYSIQVTLTVPPSLSPDWPSNGVGVTNTAAASASNAATVTSSVVATVTVPYTVATAASATWAPPTTQFKVGEASTLTLTTRNTSNARAETLTLLAPTDPAATSNLFESVDFAGFGAVTMPQGADRVRVDVWDGSAWIDGALAATPALPPGVSAADVRGLRILFASSTAGAQLVANGSAGSIVLDLAQRAATRGGTSLITGATITANVRGSVAVPNHGTQLADASATYTIGGLTSAVSGATAFSTARIPAGGWTVSTVTGRNASNGNLASLTVAQPAGAFLTDDVTFGGFRTSGAAWPDGATEATVTWSVSSGAAPAPVVLTAGAGLPATPTLTGGARITGFSVEYRGVIPIGATAAVPFRVDVAADAVPADPGTGTFTQTARIDGANDAGSATPATPAATLTVLSPQVDVTATKTVTPEAAVPAGGRSVVQLRATTSSDSGYVAPSRIVLTDVMGADPRDYWRGFDAVAIAPTQVPAGATLLIEGTTDGTTWTEIDEITAGGSAVVHQAALADGADLVGLRFTFTRDGGFAQASTMQANIAFGARGTVRGTTDPTSTGGAEVAYLNTAGVEAIGDVLLESGDPVVDTASATATGLVKSIPPGGDGLMFAKTWVPVSGSQTVSSQSGQTRTVRLSWGVEVSGYDEVTLTDPSDPTAAVGGTVFQTFDLARIPAVTAAMDPLLRYDQVTDVELYSDATDSWVSVFSSVCSPASACRGAFPGLSLSSAQRADTLGLRITFAEYAAARTSDPLAPPVGSGVASGPDTRAFDLVFQLRNRARDTSALSDPSDPWVTGDRVYNDVANGAVRNDARMTADTASAGASSSILVLDPVPGLALTKAQQAKSTGGANISSPVPIPVPGDVAAGSYPTVQYTMTATNTSAARAWYLRVTDQMPCTTSTVATCAGGVGDHAANPYAGRTWDAATSPFEQLTIRAIDYTLSTNSGIDTAASTVVLWYADGTSASMSLTVADALTATQLQNVVGVSALFAGATADGGTIASGATATLVLETRLRATLRSTGMATVPTSVTNSAFAQVWDGVLDTSATYASASRTLTLVDASIGMSLAKSATVTSILEANRSANTTVTITADQGTSTASTRQVVVEDVDPDFWNTFELRSLTSVSMPSGANRIRVDVQLNGSSTWTLGAEAASAGAVALPAGITNSQVTGLRVTYRKADDSLFSTTAPAASWTTSIVFVARLRATLRDGSGSIAFPSSLANDVSGTSTHPSLPVATAAATRAFTLDPGTFRVDVEKRTPVKTTPAGETVAFSLLVKNTGTGYLDNPVVVDQLPVDAALAAGGPLLFDPTSEITYSTSTGGILPTTGVQWAYDAAGRSITFTWPAGSRLAPGETYTIVVPLQVAPGLPAAYGDVVNTMTFTSDRTLAACTNASGNGEGVTAVGANGCRTSNDVQTISASAISSFKGVQGDVGTGTTSTTGAVNVNNAATACIADAQGFFRNPCAANTRIGATDLWKLQFTNGGNVPALTATVVDVLPRTGDVYLGTGTSRGSTYRPVFAGDVRLATDALSAGTTIAWQVTTNANPCPSYTSNSTCSTATWVDGATFDTARYDEVRAIRVQYTFPGGELPPAATVAVTYRTVNTPTSTAGDGRAPVTVPLGTPRAWNSFGVFARFPTGYTDRRVEPVRAGVQLASGPLQVAKAITGPSAAYAPTSFGATASCTVAGATVGMPSSGALTLAATNATPYTARIDGIPLGAECTIVETTRGQSSVSYSPDGGTRATLSIATAAGSTAPVPAAQRATITNSYGTTDLTIEKVVSTQATVGAFGPFSFTLACAADTGTSTVSVPLAAGDASFTLADGGSRTITGLPVTATCTLRESDSDGATSIGVRVGSGSSTTVSQNGPVTIALGTAASYTATVTNSYASGLLAVRKEVTGATGYGDAEFTVEVECTYDGQTLFDDSFTLEDGDTETLTPRFPVGTVCDIAETDAGGATVAAGDRSVTIATGTTTTVLTNRFDVGTLRIDKTVTGPGARFGEGPFEAQVSCTWDRPGASDLVIPLPNAGLVELSARTGYTAEVTGLIAGADCTVTETKTGASTSRTVSTPSPATIPANGESVVGIENRYAVGSLRVDKAFDVAPGAEGFTDGPFEIELACGIDRDGTWYELDLGGDATQTLSDANGYTVTVDDLLEGATCVVTETDRGLAVSSATTPADGTVVIPAAAAGPVVVTVTNTFLVGGLDVEKTVDESLVQGGDSVHYAIAVENDGDVDAGGVTVTDALDDDLALDRASLVAPGWTCDLTGDDADGYGGTLACELDTVLGVGATAPGIAYTATLRPEVAQDTIDNTAVVASTTTVVRGDSSTVSTPVTWLDVTASTECVQDAPWLDYSIDARNLDVSGRTMNVDWLAADGTVIQTDDVAIAADGLVTGRLLFPGSAVDAQGDGILWPGYRAAAAGETPDWENLVLDPTLPSYALRSGASVAFRINPESAVAITYPPATASCGETPGDLASQLWMSKKASTASLAPGDVFTYTMELGNDGRGAVTGVILVDDVPEMLRILKVTPQAATRAGDPEWLGCTVADRLASGLGGTITCELDRDLGANQRTPDVLLEVQLSRGAPAGAIVNTAKVTAYELPTLGVPRGGGGQLTTLALQDSAVVMAALAVTGASTSGAAQLALVLLAAGGLLASLRRRARHASRARRP